MDGEADWNLEIANAADEPLTHIVLKTTLTELQEACRRAENAPIASMIDVVDFAHGPVSASVAENVFSNDLLRRNSEASKLQVRYYPFIARLSSVILECDT